MCRQLFEPEFYRGVCTLQVKVSCRRIGGAFGGKSSRCMPPAAAAAVAASKLGRPVRYVLNRNDDMRLNAGDCTLFSSCAYAYPCS